MKERMEPYLLGIDLGTTGCKSMVFDQKGNILGKSYIEYDLIFTPDGVEQDAELWWKHVCVTAREAVSQAGAQKIAALAVSAQGIAGVPVAKDGRVLMNAISWLDNRSAQEMDALCRVYGEERLFYETGKNPGAYSLPQVMWLRVNRPRVFEEMDRYLLAMDFITYRMTGRMMTDYSMACGTMAYHVGAKQWMRGLLDQTVGDVFAPIGCMGDRVGTLLPEAAEALGLSESVIVALGAQDQKCAALGAGIGPGIATVSLGTSAAMCTLVGAPLGDDRRFVNSCGMDETHWLLETTISTAGAALKWLRHTFFEGTSYEDLNRMAEKSPCGANGVMFFPHFTANGAGDASGTFTGIGLATQKEDVVRAVMEGVCHTFASHLGHHERLGGALEAIHLFGGGALSAVWRQMLADMTGKPVMLPATHETGCLGAAILAAKGAGLIVDAYHPAGLLKAPAGVTRPDEKNQKVYDAQKGAYEAFDQCIRKNRNLGGMFYE